MCEDNTLKHILKELEKLRLAFYNFENLVARELLNEKDFLDRAQKESEDRELSLKHILETTDCPEITRLYENYKERTNNAEKTE